MNAPYTEIKLIRVLKEEIKRIHGCNCAYVDSVRVHDNVDENLAWNGVIEVFKLFGHPEAEWAFGWRIKDRDGMKYFTALDRISLTQIVERNQSSDGGSLTF